jgi:hypothetical protein
MNLRLTANEAQLLLDILNEYIYTAAAEAEDAEDEAWSETGWSSISAKRFRQMERAAKRVRAKLRK